MKSKNNNQKQLNDIQLPKILKGAEEVAKTAKRHNKPLSGSGFYPSKFSKYQAEATINFTRLSKILNKSEEKTIKDGLSEIDQKLKLFFETKNNKANRGELKNRIIFLLTTVIEPAIALDTKHTPSDDLLPLEVVKNTREYIERVAGQACGSYDQGWYDASAVMCRRLLETLIIECFEAYNLSHKIKKSDDTFFYLRDLITALMNENSWNIGRNVKQALPRLKDIGDQSAHSRRYLAKKRDLDDVKRDLRITIEELVHLGKLTGKKALP